MLLPILAAIALGQTQPDVVTVVRDDTRIERSCVVRIAPGTVIADANGDGVIHIAADGIIVTFEEGSVLRGAEESTPPDQLTGIGIRLDGHTGVTISNASVAGYKVGIRATDCDGLTVASADLSGNWRQHLKSTPKAEDGSDWLWPHNNDGDEWTNNYGAALSIKNAKGVTLRDILVRRGQNGIVLDRVTDSKVYDNDCSFLSGWGLALWRSSRNTITDNALDFCVRGYSHGVYNRGQDSAGMLIFEQCDENVIAYNSITHGGDGIFGFGGREAIGETPAPAGFDYRKRGNRGNAIVGNDLSYAPAHGLEMTFSHDQTVTGNRFVQNAICGIWGGYSQNFLIAGNTFEANGDMAYGLERGGINMEHAADNRIVENTFKSNKCGVHLWWDNDAGLLEKPGVKENYKGVTGNIVANNTFSGDRIGVQIRDGSDAKNKADGNTILGNSFEGVERDLAIDAGVEVAIDGPVAKWSPPSVEHLGKKRPVGARERLAGRENIIMTEWGPWEHEGPFVRLLEDRGGTHVYELFNIDPRHVKTAGVGLNVGQKVAPTERWTLEINASSPGVALYQVAIDAPGYKRDIRGGLLKTEWDVIVFPWKGDGGPNPPADLEDWRGRANADGAVSAKTERLSFQFGSRGPSQMEISPEVTAAKFKSDYFGIIATTRVPLTKGTWKVTTTSDDGVRVVADGDTIIENWTHHGATTDEGTFELAADGPVDLRVEYFEIFGGAVLDVKLERVGE
jgi:parallel beta-helix repeat protein